MRQSRYVLWMVLALVMLAIWQVGGDTLRVNSDKKDKIEISTSSDDIQRRSVLVTRVFDGDTIEVEVDGVRESVRLIGVDTPEMGYENGVPEPGAEESYRRVKGLVDGKIVMIEMDESQGERDVYDRLLAYVWLDDVMINKMLIEEGLGVEYTHIKPYRYQAEFQKVGGSVTR
jgi:endonuclease YncB( thermonuclease family)